MPSERFISAGGVRARMIEEGSGSPVLLVHGVGGWAENWQPTLTALASAGFRAIACDLPGFGRSERPRKARYFDPRDPYYVRYLDDVLDAAGVESVSLVGHSLGGAVAIVTTICRPGRVRRLVLVSPGGFGEEVALSFRLLTLPLADLLAALVPSSFVRGITASNFRDPSRAPAWLYEDALRYARAGGAAEFVRVMRQVVSLFGQSAELRRAWEGRASEVRCPTLILWARQDGILPVGQAAIAGARFPHARLEIVEDAGHLVMLERPEEFNRALLAFLQER